ncbi:MAG: hypothetical protein KDA55_09655 [Planctomycetales bacterium]|nr:hypothetical protein [Planctomycetales bacterium]
MGRWDPRVKTLPRAASLLPVVIAENQRASESRPQRPVIYTAGRFLERTARYDNTPFVVHTAR